MVKQLKQPEVHLEPRERAPRYDLRKYLVDDEDLERMKDMIKPGREAAVDSKPAKKPVSLFDDEDRFGQVSGISKGLTDAYSSLSDVQFLLMEGGLQDEKKQVLGIMEQVAALANNFRTRFKIAAAGSSEDLEKLLREGAKRVKGMMNPRFKALIQKASNGFYTISSKTPDGGQSFWSLAPVESGYTVVSRSYGNDIELAGDIQVTDVISGVAIANRLNEFASEVEQYIAQRQDETPLSKTPRVESSISEVGVNVVAQVRLVGEADEFGFKCPCFVTEATKDLWKGSVKRAVTEGVAFSPKGEPDYEKVISLFKDNLPK